jgi:uncharacterized membrane protein YozB (DUF420 family)
MENKKITLITKIIVGIIAVVGLIFYIMIMQNPDNADTAIDYMLNFTYIVLGFTVLLTFWVWLKELLSHPQKLKETAIVSIIFLGIVLFAKYVLASNQPEHYYPNINIDATTSNWVDTGLYTFYILGAIAVLLMFLSPLLSKLADSGSKSSNNEDMTEEAIG